MSLCGKTYLVTGAASGIGFATANLISTLGGTVVGLDLDEKGLKKMRSQLNGEKHVTLTCDLRFLESISSCLIKLVQEVGPLSGIVHAAGLPCALPLKALEVSAYQDSFRINTEAGLALARAFQSKRVYAGVDGSIVFIASVMGLVGSPCAIAYSMSKGALLGMARSMALELAPKGIRVNCVVPGYVRTPMLERVSKDWDPDQNLKVSSLHPLGLGEPEDVANAIVFLLAKTGKWITGSALTIDGGYTAH